MEIRIIPMQEVHVDEVYAIEEKSFLTPWTRQAIRDEVKNPLATYLVAMDGEKLLAYGGFWTVAPEGYINNVAVDPSYRGQGISRLLMEALIEAAREKGVKDLYLEVRVSNSIALGLYRSLGFKMIDIRKGYYADTDEDAIVMVVEIE